MKVLMRLGACVATSIALFLAGVLLWTWLGGPSPLDRETLELCRVCWEETIRGEALSSRDGAVCHTLDKKRQITDDLVEGKITLSEALQRFRETQSHVDDGLDDVLGAYHATDRSDEAVAKNLRRWLYSTLRHDPAHREAYLAKFDAECKGAMRHSSN